MSDGATDELIDRLFVDAPPTPESIDLLFDTVDDMLLAERFDEVNALFERLAGERLEVAVSRWSLAVALLTVTLGSGQHCPARASFVEALRAKLSALHGDGHTNALLDGLESI